MRPLLTLAAALMAGSSTVAVAHAIQPTAHVARHATAARVQAPTVARTYDVVSGYGDDDYAANIFNPEIVKIYAGDTVRWHNGGLLEPHDVAFGPTAALAALAATLQVVTPQKTGPPVVTVGPQFAFPSPGTTYDGMGVAHSGLLVKGNGPNATWSLTFTKPGTYRYVCLIHYVPGSPTASMGGVVQVLPRPAVSHVYRVASGYDNGTPRGVVDTFFPEGLTIHTGDTVVWTPGGFHTVAFGPPALLAQLRRAFITVTPRPAGPPTVVYNPRVIFPSGGSTYAGMGFVTSGLLVSPRPHAYTLTFTRPGVYHYACLVHPGMDGTVTVLAASQ